MSLKDILEFNLIETNSYSLSVYHLLIAFIILLIARFFLGLIHKLFRRQEKRERLEIGKSRAIFQIIK